MSADLKLENTPPQTNIIKLKINVFSCLYFLKPVSLHSKRNMKKTIQRAKKQI